MKIIIDIGHTKDYSREHPEQYDSISEDILGKLGFDKDKNDSIEHRLNKFVGEAVKVACDNAGIDAEIVDYPELNNTQDISKTISYANQKKPDLFVSIHANATGNNKWKTMECTASGTVVLYYPGSTNGKRRAQAIADTCKLCRKNNGGPDNRFEHTAPSSVSVLAKTNMPAVLVETCFYDNKEDLRWTIDNKEKLAKAIVDGILKQIY